MTEEIKKLIIYTRKMKKREPLYRDYPEEFREEIRGYLESNHISRLYAHQVEMFEKVRAGENVVITTSTASGKTLAFLLPVLQEILEDPLTRAIFIYPTKALASDQYRAMQSILKFFGEGRVSAGVYDGDTKPAERTRIRKSANIILTNPEMLNSAFLPNHSNYGFDAIFANLRYVVIDELHSYRGAFGAHLANIFRRMHRICRYYHSNPHFLCSSATIANPVELAEKICGSGFTLIDRDGSPAPEKEYCIIQPPEIKGNNDKVYGRIAASTVAAGLIPELVEEDYAAYRKGRTQGKYKDDLFQIFPLLEKAKRQQNKMSFADLLEEGTQVAKEQEEVLDLKWIIVDEVQDSDEKQLKFLEALKGTQTHFFAVGDPNQVIYSWRGTGPNMFFLIKHRFGAKELTLPVNYRSDEVILEAANRFLQFGGKIEGSGERGEKILVRNHYDSFIEAEYLTERIRELHEQGFPYREIAVFYRVQKQAEILEKVFERAELPYVLPAKQKEDEDPVPERPHMIREYVAEGKLNAVSGEHTMEKAADTERQTEEEDAVHLMTLHASKGLEFDYVFIIGMNQGLIPLRCKSIEQEEEERRLFFVGLTRARKNLELSYYTNPTIPGTYETPSNYLRMLPEELLDWEEKPGSESRKANLQKLRKDTRELIREKKQEEEEQKETRKPERKGRHPKYGEGEIISEDEMMIELEFPGYGKKQFLKAFGEVEVLKGL